MIMSNTKYVLLKRGLLSKGNLVEVDKVSDEIKDYEQDYYISTFYYNQDHFNKFKETGSVKGIRDVLTDKLWFDFDAKEIPEKAKEDAIEVCNRLKKTGVPEKDIEIYFSSGKGFHVLVTTKRSLTPEQVASVCINKYGKGLASLDASLYDSAQVLRAPATKNPKTNLYKIPLSFKDLSFGKI
jgi:DNA primase catalytic subunit